MGFAGCNIHHAILQGKTERVPGTVHAFSQEMDGLMKTNIDIKSAILGLFIGAIAMIGIASSTTSNGRFQLCSEGAYALIIDTDTGKVWSAQFVTAAEIKATDSDFYDNKLK